MTLQYSKGQEIKVETLSEFEDGLNVKKPVLVIYC